MVSPRNTHGPIRILVYGLLGATDIRVSWGPRSRLTSVTHAITEVPPPAHPPTCLHVRSARTWRSIHAQPRARPSEFTFSWFEMEAPTDLGHLQGSSAVCLPHDLAQTFVFECWARMPTFLEASAKPSEASCRSSCASAVKSAIRFLEAAFQQGFKQEVRLHQLDAIERLSQGSTSCSHCERVVRSLSKTASAFERPGWAQN